MNNLTKPNYIITKSQHETCEVIFVGDTSFGENFQARRQEQGHVNILEEYGYEYPMEKMRPMLMSADLVIANLESPITDLRKSPFQDSKPDINWSDTKETPKHLLVNNIRVVSLANDHIYDFGKAGFNNTLEILNKNKIDYFGAGNNIKEASAPYLIEVNLGDLKIQIAIFSVFQESQRYRVNNKVYSEYENSEINSIDIKRIEAQIKKIKASNPDTIAIIFPHWGKKYDWKMAKQTRTSDALLKAGADIIIGHGAHRLQEIEKRENKWVVYGIGNFMFNSYGQYKKRNAPPFSLVTKLIIESKNQKPKMALRLYPIVSDNIITNFQPRFVSSIEFNEVCRLLESQKVSKETLIHSIKRDYNSLGYYFELPIDIYREDISKKKWVGLICNVHKEIDVNYCDSGWLFIAKGISDTLKTTNTRLLIYSFKDVNTETKEVNGYYMYENKLIPICTKIPKINYKWQFGMKLLVNHENKITVSAFKKWAVREDIILSPTLKFERFVRDKYRTHQLISLFDTKLSPDSEIWEGEKDQLKHFFSLSDTVFIKPREGKIGDGIIVIKKEKSAYLLNAYHKKKKHTHCVNNITEVINLMDSVTSDEPYLIQKGIEIAKYNDAVFDVRVITVFDGISWQSVNQTRVGVHHSQLSNIHQGGKLEHTEYILMNIFGETEGVSLLRRIIDNAMKLSAFIAEKYPNEFFELAMDYLISPDGEFCIAELNTNPGGLVPEGISDPLDIQPDEMDVYQQYTLTHGNYIANWLMTQNKMKK